MKILYFVFSCSVALGFLTANVMGGDNVLSGKYTLVDIRRASNVAGGTIDERATQLLGSSALFETVLSLPGKSVCSHWVAVESPSSVVNIHDPMLSDTQIPPLDGDVSSGDKRINISINLMCKGKAFYSLVKVDERVLIAASSSGLGYFIFEKPLSESQTNKLQFQLKDMKFYSGTPSSVWGENSLLGLSLYAEYRGSEYRFLRTALTENILDGLYVLSGH
ncbi:hypothetical protein [Neptunomonas sp.]|uniref:hypothetical protein n=1 Tax=Neptunomonas sp. TaxID=1971898 RepID=UPI0025FF19E4|nr:hypothetical protein [Neptunomonas sp.]